MKSKQLAMNLHGEQLHGATAHTGYLEDGIKYCYAKKGGR